MPITSEIEQLNLKYDIDIKQKDIYIEQLIKENQQLKKVNKEMYENLKIHNEKNNEFADAHIELLKEKMVNQEYIVDCEKDIEYLKKQLQFIN